MNIKPLMRLFLGVNWLKTFRINLHYFSLSDAVHLPIILYWRTHFNELGGDIILEDKPRFGMIRIGTPRIGVQDFYYSRTIIQWGG